MIHGLLWLPLLMAFILIASLGWIERRRQNLYLVWAKGSELAKLDGTGAARLKAGILCWSSFEAGSFKEEATFEVKKLEMVELMALSSGEAPLTKESEGRCRLRLIGFHAWFKNVRIRKIDVLEKKTNCQSSIRKFLL